MWKRFDDARVLVTIHLYNIDESNFGFGAGAERFEDGCEAADFAQGEALDLVGAGAPVHGGHEALPDAVHELGVWNRGGLLSGLDDLDNLRKDG